MKTYIYFILLLACVSSGCKKNKYKDCENGTISEKLVCDDGTWKVEIHETGINSGDYTQTWVFKKDGFVKIDGVTKNWEYTKKYGQTNTLVINGDSNYEITSSDGMSLVIKYQYNTNYKDMKFNK